MARGRPARQSPRSASVFLPALVLRVLGRRGRYLLLDQIGEGHLVLFGGLETRDQRASQSVVVETEGLIFQAPELGLRRRFRAAPIPDKDRLRIGAAAALEADVQAPQPD